MVAMILLGAGAGAPLGQSIVCHVFKMQRHAFGWGLAGVLTNLIAAVVDLVVLGIMWFVVAYAGLAGICAFIAWWNRPHRLVVVPAGGRS
jgi:hypothetical protein